MAAKGYLVLEVDDVRKLNSVEGNSVGSRILARFLDTALGGATTSAAAAAAAQATANAAVPTAKIATFAVAVPAGSATPAAIAVAGLLASDKVLGLTQKTANANKLLPVSYVVADGLLTVVYASDPGASGVLNLAVLHA